MYEAFVIVYFQIDFHKIAMHWLFYRDLSYLHMEALNRFRSNASGNLEFPALHRELFPC